MVIIGLTGNIGTGKSTVSAILAELGACVIDADKLGHQVLMSNTQAWREIVATFGKSMVAVDGEIDKKKLAEAAFSDPLALERLNQITHPPIINLVKQAIDDCRRKGVKVVVVEAPLLIEAEWTLAVVDQVWLTVAPEECIIDRLTRQRGLDEETIRARLRRQKPPGEKTNRANVVINTDCNRDELKKRVAEAWNKIGAQ
jgi:dephospho-CoA kinase